MYKENSLIKIFAENKFKPTAEKLKGEIKGQLNRIGDAFICEQLWKFELSYSKEIMHLIRFMNLICIDTSLLIKTQLRSVVIEYNSCSTY